MIRTIFVVLFVSLFLILSSPLMAIEYFRRKKHPESADYHSLRIVQWAFKGVLLLSGAKVTIEGLEKIPKDQGVLFVGNHRGFYDTVAVYGNLPYLTGFVSKKSILKVPLLRVWMKRLHCLFLDRDDPRSGLQMILDGIELIKSGISVFIFPEGTRNKNENMDDLLEFKAGAVKMASKSGCPIVPVAIFGTQEILEAHFPMIRSGRIRIYFGDPILPNELEAEEKKHLAAYVQEVERKLIKEHMSNE